MVKVSSMRSLLATVSTALRAPTAVGENSTVKVVVPPSAATDDEGWAVTVKSPGLEYVK
jgi:hypothetical protein